MHHCSRRSARRTCPRAPRVLGPPLALLLLCTATGARAQESFEIALAPPGARAAAMGGAFVALADDATASEANPAGLTVLGRPELSAHFRHTAYDVDIPSVGGSSQERLARSVTAPTFFSAVLPWKALSAAVYFQRAGETVVAEGSSDRERLEHLGLSLGWNALDTLSVGASVRRSRIHSRATTFDGRLAEATFAETSFNAGIQWRPHTKLAVGAVLKKGVFLQPDTLGAGLAFRPSDRWTITGDLTRELGWATTPRIGGEYAFPFGRNTLALRAGGYRDTLTTVHDGQGRSWLVDRQLHLTFGGGVVLGGRVQLDAALDAADGETEVLLSTVVRF
jgi:hypothetical protein